MTDHDTSPLRRVGRVVQRLWRTDGQAPPTAALPPDGASFPLRLRLLASPPLDLDEALLRASRLLVVDPPGGNGRALLAAIAARPPSRRRWGILLTESPALPPEELVGRAAMDRGARPRPNAAAAALSEGRVVWLLPDPVTANKVAAWLADCLTRYPHSPVLLVTTSAAIAPPIPDMLPATIEPLEWLALRSWFLQRSYDARLTLARIGVHDEARAAAAASETLRETLAGPLPPGGRLAAAYAAWIDRLLDTVDSTALTRAADLAWQAHVSGVTPAPSPPILRHLMVEPAPDMWAFAHPALVHALAARADAATLDVLIPKMSDPAWREVIALWAASAPAAPALLDHLIATLRIEPDAGPSLLSNLPLLLLALRVLEEMGRPNRALEATILVVALQSARAAQMASDTATARILTLALADYQGIADIRDPAMPALALARHPAPAVRVAAIACLADAASETVRRELRARLADEDPHVARAAAQALGRAGSRGAPALALALADPRETVHEMAITGLAEAGAAALPILSDALGSRDARVARGAARALAALGALGAPALARGLASDPASPAADALVELGGREPEAVLVALAAPGGVPRPHIVTILRRVGEPMRRVVLRELERPGAAAADLALDLLAQPDTADAAVATALTRALKDPRVGIRLRAEAALARLGPGIVPTMLHAAADSPDLQGRVIEIAARLPGVLVDAALVRALLSVLRTARPEVRLAAVRLLGQTPAPEAIDSLVAALQDPDPSLRAQAARALAEANAVSAAATLAEALAGETAAETQAALLEALGRLNLPAAQPAAISALAAPDDRVRKAAIGLLRQAGPRAVDAIVEAVCLSASPTLRANAIDLLADYAGRAASAAEPAYEVARVWHGLLTQRFSPSGARERTADLGWWGHGREVYLSYATAETFLTYQAARQLADAEAQLYWVSDDETWLRPQVQEVLRSLGRLGAQVDSHLSAPGLDTFGIANRRLGLQTLEQRLRGLEDALDPARLDLAPFIDVIRHWRELVRRAAAEASGAPNLTLTPLTDRVRLHDDRPVTLSVVIDNEGDGAARAVRVALDGKAAERDGLKPNATSWLLPVIEPRQSYRLEFGAHVGGAGSVPLVFRVRYEDAQHLTTRHEVVLPVSFVHETRPYRDPGLNPYIAGPPIRVQEMFFGRQATLKWIEDQLVGKHGHNVLILYGERRTGKTSVLYHVEALPRFGGGRYVFALIDLQQMAYWLDTTAHFYYGLAHRLSQKLSERGIPIARPALADFEAAPGALFDDFVRDTVAALRGRTLVIMLDEFDLLLERFRRGQIDLSVADHIRALIQHQEHLAFIFTGAHRVRAMVEDPKTILFNTAFRRQIGFLAESDARALIREPVDGLIEYDNLAVERILAVTHGHPYFIQYVCHTLFERLKEDRRNLVDLTDVVDALDDVVQDAMGNIANGYAQLSMEHRVILAALARVVGEGRRFVRIEDVIQQLEEYNINIPRRERDRLLEDLKRRDFIEGNPPASTDRIGFTMDLVKMWLSQRADHELRDLPGTPDVI